MKNLYKQREIKFRIWCPKHEAFAYPDGILGHLVTMNGRRYNTGYWQDYDLGEDLVYQQFTGLKDKNGVDIYEGDICKTYNIDEPIDLIDKVVFDNGSFVFQNDFKLSIELRGFKADYIEVIGNIFENPEL